MGEQGKLNGVMQVQTPMKVTHNPSTVSESEHKWF